MFFSFTLVSSWEIRNGSTNWKYTEKITFSLWHSAYIFTSYFFTVVYFSWCDAVHWSRDQSAPPWHLVTSSDVLLTSDTVRGPHLAPAHPDLGDLGCLRLLLLLVELLDGLDLLLELHPPEIRITISLRTQESVQCSLSGGGSARLSQGEYFLSEDLRSPENVFNLLVPAPALCAGWLLHWTGSVCPHHYLCHNLARPQQHL